MGQAITYKTIQAITEGLYREKGSRFLAFAIPCNNASEAKAHIQQFWKKHPGAVHVCYAWRLGKRKFEERYSDDGEPANSAGKPIFGQILSFDVTNVLIAVVRYYGGTNLGVGGLMHAYKTASAEALEKATIVEQELLDYYELQHPFDQTGEIMHLLQRKRASILKQTYDINGTTIQLTISQKESTQLEKELNTIESITLTKTGSDE